MKKTALLTGRGNNTLRDKNILPICGKPCMWYPASEAKRAKIDEFYVSSDDEKILSIGEGLGYRRIERPLELSLPTSQHKDVIYHALTKFDTDILVVLLANNVTVKGEWIDDCVDMLMNSDASAVVPVYKDNDHHPMRAKRGNPLESFYNFECSSNRQDLEDCYFLAHNFWVLRIPMEEGQAPWGFMGKNVLPYVIEKSIDIHTEDDIRRAEEWLGLRNNEKTE